MSHKTNEQLASEAVEALDELCKRGNLELADARRASLDFLNAVRELKETVKRLTEAWDAEYESQGPELEG